MANGSSPQYRLGSRGDLSFPDAMVYEKEKKRTERGVNSSRSIVVCDDTVYPIHLDA
jgi:hypothetical protein